MMAAQAAHAATAVIWRHRGEAAVQEYMKGVDGGTMRKVVTEVADDEALRDLARILGEAGHSLHEVGHAPGSFDANAHRVLCHQWKEQPENTLTCVALVPDRRSSFVGEQTLGEFMKARARLYR